MTARDLFPPVLLGLLFTALLNLPVDPTALRYPWFWAPPVELVLLAAAALFAGRRRARAAGWLAVFLLVPLALLALIESLVWNQFGRPLALATDIRLLPVLVDVARDVLPADLVLAGLALLVLTVAVLGRLAFAFAAGIARRAPVPRRGGALLLATLAILALVVQQEWGEQWRHWRLAAADGSRRVLGQIERYHRTRVELARLERAFAEDPLAGGNHRLARLEGVDVLLLFIESYGRSALADPQLAATLRPRLVRHRAALGAHGLATASGWFVSPTIGGQSWLAHETLLSGLRLDNQAAYALLFTRRRTTLVDLFAATGHRTVLAMPAISRPWPESAWFGFDRHWFADDFGYRGPKLGFTPVPDQFALATLARRELGRRPGGRPVFAEIVLVSSHAPFTPVPELLPEDQLGDGRIFARFADRGEPAALVWRDRERIRTAYAAAVGYSLDAALTFARRVGDRCTLVIVLGDHQPAARITGAGADRAVPVHLVAGDPALLAPFARLGFVPGLLPDPAAAATPMEALRDFLARQFAAGPSSCGGAAAISRRPPEEPAPRS